MALGVPWQNRFSVSPMTHPSCNAQRPVRQVHFLTMVYIPTVHMYINIQIYIRTVEGQRKTTETSGERKIKQLNFTKDSGLYTYVKVNNYFTNQRKKIITYV